jgi:hypothetical protein
MGEIMKNLNWNHFTRLASVIFMFAAFSNGKALAANYFVMTCNQSTSTGTHSISLVMQPLTSQDSDYLNGFERQVAGTLYYRNTAYGISWGGYENVSGSLTVYGSHTGNAVRAYVNGNTLSASLVRQGTGFFRLSPGWLRDSKRSSGGYLMVNESCSFSEQE